MSAAPVRDRDEIAAVAPEFYVRDLQAAIRFYVDQLGFQLVYEKPDFAVVLLGKAFVLLADIAAGVHYEMPDVDQWLAGAPRGIGVNIRIMVEDVVAIHKRAVDGGARIAKPIGDRDYGLRDFVMADLDGYLLRFASPLRG